MSKQDKRDWKPGDVAMVTISGRPEQMMVRYDTGTEAGWYRGFGYNHEGKAHYSDTLSGRDADARPLVVIDPEDREQVERFTHLFLSHHWGSEHQTHTDAGQAALREFANPTPPKPEEPTGLGAVVEDAHGVLWTHVECSAVEVLTRNPWYPANNADEQPREWHDITAVRVLSEGVTA